MTKEVSSRWTWCSDHAITTRWLALNLFIELLKFRTNFRYNRGKGDKGDKAFKIRIYNQVKPAERVLLDALFQRVSLLLKKLVIVTGRIRMMASSRVRAIDLTNGRSSSGLSISDRWDSLCSPCCSTRRWSAWPFVSEQIVCGQLRPESRHRLRLFAPSAVR